MGLIRAWPNSCKLGTTNKWVEVGLIFTTLSPNPSQALIVGSKLFQFNWASSPVGLNKTAQ